MNIPVSRDTGAPPAVTLPHDVLVEQKRGQAVLIWTIGAFCIYGWEWILCAPKEYRLVWKRPMNLSSLIYIANRYFGLIKLRLNNSFGFVVSFTTTDTWSPSACKHVYLLEPIGALVCTILSQVILGNRVFAVYARSKVLAYALGAILLGEAIVGGVSISTISPPAPGSPLPCGALTGPFGWLTTYWTIPLLYDLFTFLLIAWKAFTFWRLDMETPLFTIIWHDGLLYFLANLTMNIVNVLIFVLAPEALRSVNLAPTIMFQVILSCRMFLNLKGSSDRPDSYYMDKFNVAEKLRFRSHHPSEMFSQDNSKISTNSASGPLASDTRIKRPAMGIQSHELGGQTKSSPP